ncbi:sugar ABC transporter permease [Clostridium estertheticum]|uniref:carbohydrate ABC transporter permease n=1 Tax=Clostridium estertheticum TaxID=238834 RepID=UPI001C0B7177|nr:sugar ABC transporter permease [Clostridium estertheticum]MBU3216356.1 sugar ABC transporter permease [Clostridium estertheticum]WAG58049.1 sugar ABC transporter permease [Clostridium estertheticum]
MAFYIMTIPALILFFTFHTLPLIKGIFYSFTDWNGYSDWKFIGFKNFINVFQDDTIRNAYGFTFKFAILTTIIVNVISLAIAIALNSAIKFKNVLRAIYFLPNILGVLIVGYIFNYVFAQLLPQFGTYLNIPILSSNILGNPNLAWLGIVFVASWQSIAFSTIIYISGLQTIDQDIYEAGEIDGASKWKTFKKITFPLIAPFFTINMVLSLKNSLMVFDQIIAMTGGGPGNATQSISYVIFHFGFSGGNFAYQSANAVLYFIVIVAISLFQLRVLAKREVDL